jgi:voltage-gated potassium channel
MRNGDGMGSLHDLRLFVRYFREAAAVARHILLALVTVLLLLAFVIAHAEHQTYGHALYFTAITGLTVGYGDISPVTPLGRVASIVVAFIGVILSGIYVAIATSALTRAVHATLPGREGSRTAEGDGTALVSDR